MSGLTRVLHVDDEQQLCELVKSFLESRNDHFEVSTTTSANTALNRLTGRSFDCVVSDYQMPEMDGLEFLNAVRDEKPNLPFLLFTGRGSEEVASEATTAGVTDYIKKSGSRGTYALLANRIENAVESYRKDRELQETQTRLRLLVEEATDAIYVVSRDGLIDWANPVTQRMFGRTAGETVGTPAFENVHPDDVDHAKARFDELVESGGSKTAAQFRVRAEDGSYKPVEARVRDLTDHPAVGGIVVYLRGADPRHS